jgi:hypothetical protein
LLVGTTPAVFDPFRSFAAESRMTRVDPLADIVRCGAHLLFSFAARVVAILVKNQVGDLPIRPSEELQLGIHDF